MAINKVVYGNNTLIDLTNDTVTENNLLSGATAHGADGNPVNGAVITHNVIDNLTSTSTIDALSANQGKVLKGLVDGKAEIDDAVTVANKTWSSSKVNTELNKHITDPMYQIGDFEDKILKWISGLSQWVAIPFSIDEWVNETVILDNNNQVTFHDLRAAGTYKLYCDKPVYILDITETPTEDMELGGGPGWVDITYTITGKSSDLSRANFKLRKIN